MSRTPVDTAGPARKGLEYVRRLLKGRGWSIQEVMEKGVKYLEASNPGGRRVRVRSKTRTKGTWQATTTSGDPAPRRPEVPTYWAFVDLSSSPVKTYVAPDEWVRKDIHRRHDQYLRDNGGRRPINDKSTHHAIAVDRISRWLDAWDQLDAQARA